MEQKANRKKRIGLIIGVSIGLLAFILVQQIFFKTPSFDKLMMQTASELNKTCPVMIDKETRLDNAINLPGNIFQYNYTLVNMVKDSINLQDLQNYLEPIMINTTRTNPYLKILRDHKTTMAYSYKDKNGVFVLKIDITPEKYKQ